MHFSRLNYAEEMPKRLPKNVPHQMAPCGLVHTNVFADALGVMNNGATVRLLQGNAIMLEKAMFCLRSRHAVV